MAIAFMTLQYATKVSSDIITRRAEWPCADSRRPADSLPVALASPAYFVTPRSADSMNAISSATSAEPLSVARICSSACVVLSLERNSSR